MKAQASDIKHPMTATDRFTMTGAHDILKARDRQGGAWTAN